MYPVAPDCTIYIGGVLSESMRDFEPADFSRQIWVLVDGWQQIDLLDRHDAEGRTDSARMQHVFTVIAGDSGQAALSAAEKTSRRHAFKIELDDRPPAGSAPLPSQRLFAGIVMRVRDAVDDPTRINFAIEIHRNIVQVAATSEAR